MSKRVSEEMGKNEEEIEKVLESDVVRAFKENDLSRAREMLLREIELRESHTWDLKVAVEFGFVDCVKLLLKNGVDVNAISFNLGLIETRFFNRSFQWTC